MVQWCRPEIGWFKLNIDGAFNPQSLDGGADLLISNSNVMCLCAGFLSVEQGNSWINKMLAIKKGLEAALLNNIECIIVETDALQIVKELNGEETPPWCISNCQNCERVTETISGLESFVYVREES